MLVLSYFYYNMCSDCSLLLCYYLSSPAFVSGVKSEFNRNLSEVTEFILLGFRTPPKLQILLFLGFLLVYVVTLVGNISVIVVIKMTPDFKRLCISSLETCPI